MSSRVQTENGRWAKRNFHDKEFQQVSSHIVNDLGGMGFISPRDADEAVEVIRKALFDRLGHFMPFVGMVEEMGELAHAILKKEQGIRTGEDHDAAARDAYADVRIYGYDFCNRMGWHDESLVEEVWDEIVKKRDWVGDPEKGSQLRHVCGMQGFGAPGDVCAACHADHERGAAEKGDQ